MEQSEQLGPRLRIINQLICQYLDRDLQKKGLTTSQAFILCYLSERKTGCTCQKDIERLFHLSHPTVSGILQRMEAKGLVRIIPDEADKRRNHVVLTENADSMTQDIYGSVTDLEHTMLSSFSMQETAQLFSLLDCITGNLKTQISQEDLRS